MMISDPNQLFYTCIAKGTIILAEFVSKSEPGIESIALKCIENTPPNHSMFSHTLQKKTYTFEIDDSFIYFAILDEEIEKSESVFLFNRLRSVMEDLTRSESETLINPDPHCLQSKLDPFFSEFVTVPMDSPKEVAREILSPNTDSSRGRRASMIPILGTPLTMLKKKKKRLHTEDSGEIVMINEITEKNLDLFGDCSNGVLRKEQRNGLLLTDHYHHRLKAKQKWKKHVWMVLIFDFCVCAVLFGIWLWICEGFQCTKE